jgi:hypothetical protein
MAVLDDRLMVIALDGKPLARIPLRTGFCGTAVGACGKTLLCVAARESNAVSVLVFDSNLAQLGEDRLFVDDLHDEPYASFGGGSLWLAARSGAAIVCYRDRQITEYTWIRP